MDGCFSVTDTIVLDHVLEHPHFKFLTHTFFLGIGHFSAFLIYFQFHYDSCHAWPFGLEE
jgi:hypothetical protein